MATTEQESLHVVMVPTPGMGHLIPLVELAKTLVHQHNFLVTFIVPNDGSPMKLQRQLLQTLPSTISSIFLPPVNFDDLPDNAHIEIRITLSLTRSLSSLHESFKALKEKCKVVALVVDLLGPDALEIAKEFDVLPYIFHPTNAMDLSFVFALPELDEKYSCEYKDLPQPIQFPGCAPIQVEDLVDAIQVRKSEAYKCVLHICKKYTLADGILVNSFFDLEQGAFKSLMEKQNGKPAVYPVGPLVRTCTSSSEVYSDSDQQCLKWLDKQPTSSVLFVSFGSGGTLSQAQINELALGLEMSKQRFLWVIRRPHSVASATYFGSENTSVERAFDYLPEGFLDRTKGVGLVVPDWAPQVEVLSHGSVGGFMSHCGWNSTLESIVHGVPLIAWPLYAEQKMNSVLLAEGLKVAIRVKKNENGLVSEEDIAKYARTIIEGEEGKLLKNRMQELKNGAERALSKDGFSTKSLADVANIWKNHNN